MLRTITIINGFMSVTRIQLLTKRYTDHWECLRIRNLEMKKLTAPQASWTGSRRGPCGQVYIYNMHSNMRKTHWSVCITVPAQINDKSNQITSVCVCVCVKLTSEGKGMRSFPFCMSGAWLIRICHINVQNWSAEGGCRVLAQKQQHQIALEPPENAW